MPEKSRLDWARSEDGSCGERITLKRKCEILGINRSSVYYKPEKKKKDPLRRLDKDAMEKRMATIDEIHTDMPATGARKMARALTHAGMPTTRYEAAKLMEMMNIRCIYPKPNLSLPGKGKAVFPYLLRNRRIWLPNQVWAIDITYIPYKGGHMYLTAIIDWHSRLIVGFRLADTLDSAPVLECVREAIKRYGIPAILNSDQGSHFTSKAYVALLASYGIEQSMDGRARWVDNVRIERWFRTLKTEYVRINEFISPRELARGIAWFVGKYNTSRLHEALDYHTPQEIWDMPFSLAA